MVLLKFVEFYNWNRVSLRYCDGGSFTGDVEQVDPGTGLHYRGARIFKAIMEELLAQGMNTSQNGVLSGCSAGGLATILHCDNFRTLLPKSAKVKCFSDAGYFVDLLMCIFPARIFLGNAYIEQYFNDVVTLHCFFPQNVAQQIETPLFIINAAYDWQTIAEAVGDWIWTEIAR
ncbi:hypothetical protein HAX54_036487 [Datura stramonium]|uniref:Pectin acetylesterase n=1 Tax=Datura stramonium TaxID=4076 RepID=A0ABS8SG54_DATST|nr:hypothetical protein [Datura stramonium]